jgi:hypothetical protein
VTLPEARVPVRFPVVLARRVRAETYARRR